MNALLEQQTGILSVFQGKSAEQIASYKAWFNDPTRQIGMKFKSIDIKQRTAELEVTVESKADAFTYLMTVNLTKQLMYWFTSPTPVRDSEGQLTTEMLTGFQKYLRNRQLDINTPLSKIKFKDFNGSNDYYGCPFRLNISEEHKTATLYNVQEFKYVHKTYVNPEKPDELIHYSFQPKNKDGSRLSRSRAKYRRLEVK